MVLSLGYDTAAGDPTGSWRHRPADFRKIGEAVGALGYPTLVVQEGGYRTRTLGTNARAFFTGLWESGNKTPLRAPIHDSLLLEIPHRRWDRTVEIACQEMQRPVAELPLPASWGRPGEYVTIGVAAKAGSDWQAMEKIAVPGYDADWQPEPMESEDQDDWDDLQRVIA